MCMQAQPAVFPAFGAGLAEEDRTLDFTNNAYDNIFKIAPA